MSDNNPDKPQGRGNSQSTDNQSASETNPPDYDVGFSKPPKAHQFKPGRSGNPKGRPKGSKNLSTDVRNALRQKLKLNINGKTETLTTQQALIMRLKEKGLKGDPKAIGQLLGMAAIYNDDEEVIASKTPQARTDTGIIEAYLARLAPSPSTER